MNKNQSSINEFAYKVSKEIKEITGIDCKAVPVNDNKTWNFSENGFCKTCKKHCNRTISEIDCTKLMSFSCMQSDQWGGKYESLCPVSLAFISTLIYDNKECIGLCLGPFLMVDYEDITVDIVKYFKDDSRWQILREIEKLKVVKPSVVRAYSDLMFMVSSYASKRNSFDISLLEQIPVNYRQQYEYISNTEAFDGGYPISAETMLVEHISKGDSRAAGVEANKLLGLLVAVTGGNVGIVKVRLMEVLSLVSRSVIKEGVFPEIILSMNDEMLGKLSIIDTVGDLGKWLSDMVLKYSAMTLRSGRINRTRGVEGAVEYIRKNYMRKVTLEDIAAYTNLSKSYICRIFKRDMNCGVVSYLNHVRVENAKILLLNTNDSLSEIAYLCGFDDQTYFSKVFRGDTGISPGKYRQNRGKYLDKRKSGI